MQVCCDNFLWNVRTEWHFSTLSVFHLSFSLLSNYNELVHIKKKDVLIQVCCPLDSVMVFRPFPGGRKGCSLHICLAKTKEWNEIFTVLSEQRNIWIIHISEAICIRPAVLLAYTGNQTLKKGWKSECSMTNQWRWQNLTFI